MRRSDGTLGFDQGEVVYHGRLTVIGGDLTMNEPGIGGGHLPQYAYVASLRVLYQTEA
jgi:hypothetical protein